MKTDGLLGEFMRVFTHLGDGPVQLILIALLYWVWDRELALRVGLLFMGSAVVNGVLKQGFAEPRPGWIDSASAPLSHPASFGMPSGHAQSAATWFLVPFINRSSGLLILVFIYAFLMGFSRIAIGVHSWDQVMMGWAVGLCCVVAYRWFEALYHQKSEQYSTLSLLMAGSTVVALMVLIARETVAAIDASQIELWTVYAQRYGVDSLGPAGLRHTVTPLGCLVGFGVGGLIDSNREWTPSNGFSNMLVRCFIGCAMTAGLYLVFKATVPLDSEAPLALCLRFGAGAGLGFVAFCGAPAMMRRVGLFKAG